MDIAVVGTPEFTLGFQLAGVDHLHNPEGEDAMVATFLVFQKHQRKWL